ncbi:MAG TPA: hypothetical protein VFE47_19795 [Tepidisphaeraceae bacterium]|nr:hypothetical protein [Tepidisphaeraceae bacterium]
MPIRDVTGFVLAATPATLIASGDGYYGYYEAAGGLMTLALFLLGGYYIWLNKDDFRITVRKGEVHFRGRFPPGRRAEVTAFLLQDIAPATTVRVIGNWKAGRVLRIAVQGKISAGEAQRIRNFFRMVLS